MMELVGVLLLTGLLTILALKGIDSAMSKARANKVMDDAADVYSKLSVSKKNRENWTVITPEGKSRSGFEIKGMRPSERIIEDASTYARVTVPRAICKHLVDMQSKRMRIYKITGENSVSTDPMMACEEQNDILFVFSSESSCTSDDECVSEYGSNYICKCFHEDDQDGSNYHCEDGEKGFCAKSPNFDCKPGDKGDKKCVSKYGRSYYCKELEQGGYCEQTTTCKLGTEGDNDCVSKYGSNYSCEEVGNLGYHCVWNPSD